MQRQSDVATSGAYISNFQNSRVSVDRNGCGAAAIIYQGVVAAILVRHFDFGEDVSKHPVDRHLLDTSAVIY